MCAATFWTLAFESPVLALEKHLLGDRKSNAADVDIADERSDQMSLSDINKKSLEGL